MSSPRSSNPGSWRKQCQGRIRGDISITDREARADLRDFFLGHKAAFDRGSLGRFGMTHDQLKLTLIGGPTLLIECADFDS
jgi:hypothetical protein